MRSTHAAFGLVSVIASSFLVPSAGLAADAPHAGHAAHAAAPANPPSDASLVTSAMSAAPTAVAKNAAVVAMTPDGGMRTIRDGTNGFTCMPDNPTTPGPDPMCMDANAMAWVMAWAGKKAPPQKTGFMYMLAGGTDASNTDPYAEKPTAGNNWIETGPHVMIVGSTELLSHYPAKPDPDTTQPYVMWAGTPYAHLMVPVR